MSAKLFLRSKAEDGRLQDLLGALTVVLNPAIWLRPDSLMFKSKQRPKNTRKPNLLEDEPQQDSLPDSGEGTPSTASATMRCVKLFFFGHHC